MTQTTGLRVYPGTIALGIQLEESIYCSSLEPEVDVITDECTVRKVMVRYQFTDTNQIEFLKATIRRLLWVIVMVLCR